MKDNFPSHRQAPSRLRLRLRLLPICSGLISLALLLASCGKPPITVYKHLLEYSSPESTIRTPIPEGLKVDLFSVAQAFNSPDMVYRPTSHQGGTYRYHRWFVNPGPMVTDFLLRDMRHAGLFKAIFGYDRAVKTRFQLEGAVEEFQEVDAGDAWSAVLALNITLLDMTQEEATQKVLFQKNYRAAEPLIEKTPQGLAAAMSRAMQQLSGRIMSDVHQAAWKRLTSKEKK
jgi:ABC-type uncharacterized transport system auxiliary subunit